RQVAPDRLKPEDIQGVEGVVLTNVDTIPPAAAKALGDFLYAGGGVGFLVGARTDPDRFNRTFRAGSEPIAPCRLWKTGLADGDEPVIVTWTDLRHDVFALFAGPRHGDLAVAEFRQYYQVRDSQAARVLARFSNGHPALLEMRCARAAADGTAGRSLLFASSADLEWNDLCLKGVFVPFVHQFARRLCARRSGGWARNVQVGDEVVVGMGEQGGAVQLTTPDGKARKLPVGDDGRLRYTPVRPGLHRLSYQGGSASFAANLAPGEADLTEMDTRVLLTAVQPEPAGARPLPGGAAVVSAETVRERVEQSQRLWLYLIAAGLAVLAAEMVLSARAGTA
ncbi:MAG: hypothetical protein ACYS5V_16650, partial [Planctomycetota bacterium]